MTEDFIIVSVGIDGREPYSGYAANLQSECNRLGIKNQIWIGQYPTGSPDHSTMPYAFKYFAIKNAVDAGYTKVLWLDSICRVIGNLEEIINIMDEKGYFFPPDGWYIGQWCKDEALGPLGITREEAMTMPVLAAKHMGFNFKDERNKKLLEQFKYYIDYDNGQVFRGSWTNKNHEVSSDPRVLGHRHDQTVLSVIAHKLGMTLDGDWNELITWNGIPKPKMIISVR